MMSSLPFLQPKKSASVIIAKRKADGSTETERVEGEPHPKHMEHAEQLISAIHAKDATAVASILESLIEKPESQEEEEAE